MSRGEKRRGRTGGGKNGSRLVLPTASRRQFLGVSAAVLASGIAHRSFASIGTPGAGKSDRPLVGCIGMGDRWETVIADETMKFADVVAVCDVDRRRLAAARPVAAGSRTTCRAPMSTIAICSIAPIWTR